MYLIANRPSLLMPVAAFFAPVSSFSTRFGHIIADRLALSNMFQPHFRYPQEHRSNHFADCTCEIELLSHDGRVHHLQTYTFPSGLRRSLPLIFS